MLAGDHLVGGGNDGLRFFCVQQAKRVIDRGAGAFHLRQGTDELARLTLPGDVEVLQGALRLGAPETLGGYVDLPEGVVLDSSVHGVPSAPGRYVRRSQYA